MDRDDFLLIFLIVVALQCLGFSLYLSTLDNEPKKKNEERREDGASHDGVSASQSQPGSTSVRPLNLKHAGGE